VCSSRSRWPAASASATAPAWFECGKAVKNGKAFTRHYTGKSCEAATEVGTGGKYELREGISKGKEFKGKGGKTVLHVKTWLGDATVECTSSKEAVLHFLLPSALKPCRSQRVGDRRRTLLRNGWLLLSGGSRGDVARAGHPGTGRRKPGNVLGEGTISGKLGINTVGKVTGLNVPIVKGTTYYLTFLPLGGAVTYWYSKAETVIYSEHHKTTHRRPPENYEWNSQRSRVHPVHRRAQAGRRT
jgi:hypothetical protein